MRRPRLSYCVAACISLLSLSCGDDPKLVAQRERQKAEISRLKGELALMQEKLRNMPPDVTEELEKTRKLVEAKGSEVARIEDEIRSLEIRRRSLEEEFNAYRAQYPLK
jgi:hypothetical protein